MAIKMAMYGEDVWLPTGLERDGDVCQVLWATYTRGGVAEGPVAPRAFLPVLHLDPEREHTHVGYLRKGERIRPEDQNPWLGWQDSRMFCLGKNDYLLVDQDAHAYSLTSPPADMALTSAAEGTLLPMRLGGNPLRLAKDAGNDLRPVSSCRFQDRVYVSCVWGRVSSISLPGGAKWTKGSRRPFGEAEVFLSSTQDRMWAFVRKAKAGDWALHATKDGEVWKIVPGAPPIQKGVPVYFGSRYLCIVDAKKPGSTVTAWRREPDRKWSKAGVLRLDPADTLVDLTESSPGTLLALVGSPKKRTRRGMELALSVKPVLVSVSDRKTAYLPCGLRATLTAPASATAPSLTPVGTANGVMAISKVYQENDHHGVVPDSCTATCTAIAAGKATFSVNCGRNGSTTVQVDDVAAASVSGTVVNSGVNIIDFTITQGANKFQVGDQFDFDLQYNFNEYRGSEAAPDWDPWVYGEKGRTPASTYPVRTFILEE